MASSARSEQVTTLLNRVGAALELLTERARGARLIDSIPTLPEVAK